MHFLPSLSQQSIVNKSDDRFAGSIGSLNMATNYLLYVFKINAITLK